METTRIAVYVPDGTMPAELVRASLALWIDGWTEFSATGYWGPTGELEPVTIYAADTANPDQLQHLRGCIDAIAGSLKKNYGQDAVYTTEQVLNFRLI